MSNATLIPRFSGSKIFLLMLYWKVKQRRTSNEWGRKHGWSMRGSAICSVLVSEWLCWNSLSMKFKIISKMNHLYCLISTVQSNEHQLLYYSRNLIYLMKYKINKLSFEIAITNCYDNVKNPIFDIDTFGRHQSIRKLLYSHMCIMKI